MLFTRAFVLGLFGLGAASSVDRRSDDDDDSCPGVVPRNNCNTPDDRACWKDGFDITTDYEEKTPYTNVTRQYTLVLEEFDNWIGPDGFKKDKVMLINGTIPGPTLYADWGDRLNITVINNLKINGTSIHWHGIRQLNSNLQDGVNGITECAIPPNGGRRVYNFLAQQYGTTWYHSHFSAQYGNGVVGTIIINGPASQNYDIDLGVLPISDYFYDTADVMMSNAIGGAGPPNSDNILINGTNVNPDDPSKGEYAVIKVTKGKTHRLRLINTSLDEGFTVSIVGHSMTVISTDLVPVKPVTVDSVLVAIGQRYDVLIDANAEDGGNHWFNVSLLGKGACGISNNLHPAAILRYDDADENSLPTDQGTLPPDTNCTDSVAYEPIVRRDIDVSQFEYVPGNTLQFGLEFSPSFHWTINSSAMQVAWEKPTLEYVFDNKTDEFPSRQNLIQVDAKNEWVFWLIQNEQTPFLLPHPIHLHGHDFLVVGRSEVGVTGLFDPHKDKVRLSGANPTRRDVVMLPAGGWLVIAFHTNNPGAWLMHCHIAFHVGLGLAVDFLERPSEIMGSSATPAELAQFEQQCRDWSEFYADSPNKQEDSGL